jgi:4-hydroxybenzoate polyprenyltransferase
MRQVSLLVAGCWLSLTLFVSSADAFSAHLNRPWDTPVHSQSVRLIRLSLSDLDTTKAGNEEKDGEKKPAAEEEDDDDEENEETLILQDTAELPESSYVFTSSFINVTTSSIQAVAAVTPSIISHHQEHKPSSPPEPTVKSCLPDLIQMTRPSNLPGVVLFHFLGIYLALISTDTAGLFVRIVTVPAMMITLLALLLTSSTSMLVNNYYDFKLGNDSSKLYKPLTTHKVSLAVVKRFLSYLYGAALICLTMIPGLPARLSVLTGLILTFYYTQHLKPKTWLKNVVCASLIALSPLTSGAAALALLNAPLWKSLPASLLRVVSMLFVGILGREITMDINDTRDDSLHGVRTVPVVYGQRFASSIAMACSVGVVVLAMSGPLLEWWWFHQRTGGVRRRLLLATLGSVLQLRRSHQVFTTEGQNVEVVSQAVDEGLLTMVPLLASFA